MYFCANALSLLYCSGHDQDVRATEDFLYESIANRFHLTGSLWRRPVALP